MKTLLILSPALALIAYIINVAIATLTPDMCHLAAVAGQVCK